MTAPMRRACTLKPAELDRSRILANRAERQADRRAVEDESHDGEERQGEKGERRLLEEGGADEGEVRQAGNVDRRERLDARRRGDVRQGDAVDEIGEARRQQRHADARHVLRQAERHGEQCQDEAKGGPDERRDENAAPQVQPEIDGEPARHGAGREDAFDAEIEHARPLADERAEHAEHKRRRDADGRCPKARRQQDVENGLHHASLTRKRTNSPLTSTQRSASATIRSAM